MNYKVESISLRFPLSNTQAARLTVISAANSSCSFCQFQPVALGDAFICVPGVDAALPLGRCFLECCCNVDDSPRVV